MENVHLTEMVELYYACNKNGAEARRRYAQKYAGRETPSRWKFYRLERRFRKTGSIIRHKQPERQFNQEAELSVLLSAMEDPNQSLRERAQNLNLSATTVFKIMKKHHLKAYKTNLVQGLHGNDPERRLNFCHYFLERNAQNPDFKNRVLYSDECTFGNNGLFNRNLHYHWSNNNPHIIRETNFQVRFKTNVWCGILRDRIIGPVFLGENLNALSYNRLLREDLEFFLEDLPVNEYANVIFHQDGAPPHNARINTVFLNDRFEEWMGTNGPIRYPARSPDLNPCDYFLWPYLKDKVFVTPPENLEDLENRIRNEIANIPRDTILRVTNTEIKRCAACIEHQGTQFEPHL